MSWQNRKDGLLGRLPGSDGIACSTAPRRHNPWEHVVRRIEDPGFFAFVLIVSAAFAWVVEPLFGPILWSVVAALVFAPLNDRFLEAMPKRRSRAALLTLLVIITVVVLPALLLGALLLQEASSVYARFSNGGVDPAVYFARFQGSLPHWLTGLMERLGLTDFAVVQAKLSAASRSCVGSYADGACTSPASSAASGRVSWSGVLER